ASPLVVTMPPPFLLQIPNSQVLSQTHLLPHSQGQDGSGLMSQPHSPAALPSGSLATAESIPQEAPKKGQRKKARDSPAGRMSRFSQYQQHQPILESGWSPANGQKRVQEVPIQAAATPTKEANLFPEILRSLMSGQLPCRQEVSKPKMERSEDTAVPHGQFIRGAYLYEESEMNRQKSKYNLLTKITSTQRDEGNFWQNCVPSDRIHKQEKKPFKNNQNMKKVRFKKSVYLTEVRQKENYAGAQFAQSPPPSVLPKPPSHWIQSMNDDYNENGKLMASQFKTLLIKVQT
uniref:Proline rich nuclear receptor coactivator 1 n=1 Tax=Otolemur garnettii TaxID=30611 RepID=H0XN18_OTOGA